MQQMVGTGGTTNLNVFGSWAGEYSGASGDSKGFCTGCMVPQKGI